LAAQMTASFSLFISFSFSWFEEKNLLQALSFFPPPSSSHNPLLLPLFNWGKKGNKKEKGRERKRIFFMTRRARVCVYVLFTWREA